MKRCATPKGPRGEQSGPARMGVRRFVSYLTQVARDGVSDGADYFGRGVPGEAHRVLEWLDGVLQDVFRAVTPTHLFRDRISTRGGEKPPPKNFTIIVRETAHRWIRVRQGKKKRRLRNTFRSLVMEMEHKVSAWPMDTDGSWPAVRNICKLEFSGQIPMPPKRCKRRGKSSEKKRAFNNAAVATKRDCGSCRDLPRTRAPLV